MLGGSASCPSPSPRKLAFYLSITHRLTVGYTEKEGTSAILLRRVIFCHPRARQTKQTPENDNPRIQDWPATLDFGSLR